MKPSQAPSTPSHPPAHLLLSHLHSDSNILNLSSLLTLSPPQITLLEKGLSFVPRPKRFDWEELRGDIHQYHRRIKLLDHFHSKQAHTHIPFTNPSTWEPTPSQLSHPTRAIIKLDNQALRSFHPPPDIPDNLSGEERRALHDLIHNPNIIFKPADKGSKIVILDRQQYLLEAHRQLSNPLHYTPIPEPLQATVQPQIQAILEQLYRQKFINCKQKQFLSGSNNPRPRHMYLLPKIHKDPHTWTIPLEVPPGRPIISDCNSVTYNLSQYLDSILQPLSTKHSSYIKDTYHFIQVIRSLSVPLHAHLFTIDIDSLYTNINTDAGLEAVESTFRKFPDSHRPDSAILQLLSLCLRNNDFTFNNQHYLQIHGTAMGQRFAPSYANIYMSEWEREALAKCPLKPTLFLRYLDDIFGFVQLC